ncbi:iron dicitrate transporter FecR [Tianweitania populi]|uniref:Iron dicitrate transporter FecR n=1 Tax=Tianweitania populi TaxID=1607949 RepID=A0A8J3GMY4_9HYPH|nr:FecR domain-containing protein [Tianweitania populi]GHD23761.1 iron dicitrate transporter FecR [Tianweitania populi]
MDRNEEPAGSTDLKKGYMNEAPQDRRLFREAADLAIRLQNDPNNQVSLEMVRAWVSRSPEHRAAWARVAAIHGMTGKIISEERALANASPVLSRRNLVLGGLVGVGAIATASWSIPKALLRARSDVMTAIAEIRNFELPDGSVITLGPDTAVAVRFTAAQREIDLLAGMAFFEIAHDAGRAFSVNTDSFVATALGTAFDISNDAGFISVSVDRGIVEARAPGDATRAGMRIAAGEWLSYDASTSATSHGSREKFQIGAWRTGMLVAEKETVGALVAKISRWQHGTVVVADPFLRSRVVSGVFDLQDPLSALQAVVRPFGARVREVGPFMTIISPV